MLRCAVQEVGDYTLIQLVSTLSLRTGRLPLVFQQPSVPSLTELRSCHAWILAAVADTLEASQQNHLARCRFGSYRIDGCETQEVISFS